MRNTFAAALAAIAVILPGAAQARALWPDVPPEIEGTTEAMPIRLYRVSVDVTFPSPNGGKRTYALATTRIGSKDAK